MSAQHIQHSIRLKQIDVDGCCYVCVRSSGGKVVSLGEPHRTRLLVRCVNIATRLLDNNSTGECRCHGLHVEVVSRPHGQTSMEGPDHYCR
ncbi:unnamed protein product [Lampetra fluviatilis]